MYKLPAAGERCKACTEQTSPPGAALINKVTDTSCSIKYATFLD